MAKGMDILSIFSLINLIVIVGILGSYIYGFVMFVKFAKKGIKPRFKVAFPFREGKAAACIKRENYGFISSMGEEIIPCEFTGANLQFSEGLCSIMKDNYSYYGYIDEKGETVIPFDYQYAGDFKEGMAVVKFKRKKKYGVITKSGKCVVESKFQHISSFDDGLAEVIVGDEYEKFHYGYINYDGDFVWEPSR